MRPYVPLIGVLVLVSGIALVKARQIGTLMNFGKAAKAAGPPPEAVGTAVAKSESWETTLSATGSVETVKGVALSVEVPGTVTAIHFESGATVKKGDVLVELDTRQEQAQLASAVARQKLASSTLNRNQQLVLKGAVAGAELETDKAAYDTATSDIAALQAQIAKKTLRAPFDGKLGIRAINLGQYLTPGAPVTALETSQSQYVDFTLPQASLGRVALGMPVRFALEGTKDALDGTITAIDPTVDPVSRSLKLRAEAKDAAKLRPGMFVQVTVVLPDKHAVVMVPATALVHASYGDSVFVVEPKDGKTFARQQFVRAGEMRGDFVAIETGIQADQRVVVAGAFKLRNGAPITVDDSVKPAASIAPTPENR